MKTKLFLVAFSIVAILFWSCEKENENPVDNGENEQADSTDWGEWVKVGTSNIEWFESPIVLFDGKLWQIAGERWDESGDTYLFSNKVYNSTDGLTWNIVSENPEFLPRALNRSVVFNQKLITAGGVRDGGGEGNDVWSSSDGVSWTMESSDQFDERERFGLVEFNDNLWVFGGDYYDFNVQNAFFTDDIFKSSDGKNWTEVIVASANHPLARIDFFTFVFDNKLWVISGNSNLENQSVKSDVWNTSDGITWNLVDENGPIGDIGDLISMDALVFDNKIWILHNGKAYYSVNGSDWVKMKAETNAWDRLIDVVVFNNSIYVFAESGDVWQLKQKTED